MATRHYSPQISRVLVCALYHEAKRRRQPMTLLVDRLLTTAFEGTTALTIARAQFPEAGTDECK